MQALKNRAIVQIFALFTVSHSAVSSVDILEQISPLQTVVGNKHMINNRIKPTNNN